MNASVEIRPNLFIIGFPKTGTSALFEMLGQHPDIYPAVLKEPGKEKHFRYFNPSCTDEYREYMDNFRNAASERWIMDGTVGYSLNIQSAEEIKAFSPNARIVIGIRNPLDRVASACHQIEKNTGKKINLKSAILRGDSFARLSYFPICQRYFQCFGAASIFVYQYSDFQASNARIVADLFRFLELPVPTIKPEIKNRSVQPRRGSLGRIHGVLMGSGWSVGLRTAWKRRSRHTYNLVSEQMLRLLTKQTNYSTVIREDASLVRILHERWREDVQQLSVLLGVDLLEAWEIS